MNNCKICQHPTTYKFTEKILNKYTINYFTCSSCGFTQTEEPYWLNESYENVITSTDIGLINRSEICLHQLKVVTTNLICNNLLDFNHTILDFAGGYGVFVRQARDAGFDTFWFDDFCENIFAKHFEGSLDQYYNVITAFEVFEHVYDPNELLAKLNNTDFILFSTELIPTDILMKDWWYIIPSSGQHVSFYSKSALQILAKSNGFNYYNHFNYHLFSRKKINFNPFIYKSSLFSKFIGLFNRVLSNIPPFKMLIVEISNKNKNYRKSLLDFDYQSLISKIQTKENKTN